MRVIFQLEKKLKRGIKLKNKKFKVNLTNGVEIAETKMVTQKEFKMLLCVNPILCSTGYSWKKEK